MSHDWHKHYPSTRRPEIDFSSHSSIAAAIDRAVARFSSNVAITCMGQDYTFRELDEMATAFGSFLQNDLGLKKGDRIAIMLPNLMQFPVAFLGAQKIGVICVNTNPLYTPREMRHQFADSGATAIVIVDLFLDKLEQIIKDTNIKTVISTSAVDLQPTWKRPFMKFAMKAKGMIPEHGLTVREFNDGLRLGRGKKLNPATVGLDDVAILQYTGGTTGVAKGAMLTQRNVLANMLQIEDIARGHTVDGKETVLTALPLYHIFALTVNFLAFLQMGQRMILLPKPVPIKNTVDAFKKYPISVVTGVNTLYNGLNNSREFKELAPRGIKFSVAGGMALQDSVAKEWEQITGNRILQGFGLTEASPVTHLNPVESGGVLGSIGIPVSSTNAKIVDETGKEVPCGEPGEMIINGPQVMLGYWNRPDETKGCLKDGWLWTGDIARRDEEGFFYIVDRKKDMILVSGFNVFPNEIEEVLCAHPKVREAAVIGIPDRNSGESVKAFIVPKDDSLTAEELTAYCKEHLTGYKRPRRFEFRSELPKSNVGKILRRELRDEELKSQAGAAH